MKKMNKRLISILLSIAMVFGCVALAVPAFAEDGESGACAHENCEYQYVSMTQHKKVCLDCNETITEDHDFDRTTHQCSNCNYVYDCEKGGHIPNCVSFNDVNHSMECKACEHSWTESHSYDSSTKKCTVCGHVFGGNCEEGQHYFVSNGGSGHTCAICGITGGHEFNVFGNCFDCGYHDCEGFGHVFKGGYEKDDNYHWKICDYCSIISSTGDDVENPDNKKAVHKDSNKDGVCDICNFHIGHKWQLTSHSDPTCVSQGRNEYTCYFCGETKGDTIPALGHYWFDDSDQSDRKYVNFKFSGDHESCTLTFTCRRCGHFVDYTVYTEASDKGAVLANSQTRNPIAKKVDPTCEAGSGTAYYAVFTIANVLREMNLDMNLRTIDEIAQEDAKLRDLLDQLGEDATNINTDEKAFICIETVQDNVQPPLGHLYEDPYYKQGGEGYHSNNDAKCEEDGTRTAPCDRCQKINDSVHDPDSALGHEWVETVTEATCTEPGRKVKGCSRCGTTITTIIPPSHQLDPDTVFVVEPTCTEQGYEQGECSICHQIVKSNYVSPLGHDWGEWYVSKDPNCTNPGKHERACQRCGDTQTEDYGAALGHSFVYSSTDDGSGHIAKCERCGYTIGSTLAHIDSDYDFLCDGCGAELKFWQHWLHYMVGLPTHAGVIMSRAFGDFFTKVVGFFTKYMINF